MHRPNLVIGVAILVVGLMLFAAPATLHAQEDAAVTAVKAVVKQMADAAKANDEQKFLSFFVAADAAEMKKLLDSSKKLQAKTKTLADLSQKKLGVEPGQGGFSMSGGAGNLSDFANKMNADAGPYAASGANVVYGSGDDKLVFVKSGAAWKASFDPADRKKLAMLAPIITTMEKATDNLIAGINNGSITKDNYQKKSEEQMGPVLAQLLLTMAAADMTGPKPAGAGAEATTKPAAGGEAVVGANGEAGQAGPVDAKLAEAWQSFLHYILLARPEVALTYGKAILSSNPQPRDLYMLWAGSDRASMILGRGHKMSPELAELIEKVMDLVNKGSSQVRGDPAEIKRWIQMLGGNPQEFQTGTEKLIQSGQYAVSLLLAAIADQATPNDLRDRIITILPRLGKDAVRPLVEALSMDDPAIQDVVARTLGKIGYPQALPYLKRLAEKKDVLSKVKDTCLGAMQAIRKKSAGKPAADLFYELALAYYNKAESLNPDARFETGNVWYYKPDLGVTYVPVPREIFNDVYAMRTARDTLELDAKFYPAVPLWLASYIRKEADLPEGVTDPTQVSDEPTAGYYARAAGARYMQTVLAIGLRDNDERVASGAIKALRDAAGAENLVMEVGGGQPLVQALGFPSRAVRYMSAETLALAKPQQKFNGWQMVMPVLIEALRQTGTPAVVLVDPNGEERNKIKDLLRSSNMDVYDAENLGKALDLAGAAGGVDLAVLSSNMASPSMVEAIQMFRSQPQYSKAPVVLVVEKDAVGTASRVARNDPLVVVLPVEKLDAAALNTAVDEVSKQAGGGISLSPELAADWAIRAANVLEMLAVAKNPVFNPLEALPSLIATTKDKRAPVRVAAAKALAQMDKPESQQALAELADAADVDEPVRLEAYAALATSIRQFGGQLTEKQVKAVRDVVAAKGSVKLREAAAQVLGALSLPSEMVKDLIVSSPSVFPK